MCESVMISGGELEEKVHPRPALCGNEADVRLNGLHSWKKKALLPSTLCNMLTGTKEGAEDKWK